MTLQKEVKKVLDEITSKDNFNVNNINIEFEYKVTINEKYVNFDLDLQTNNTKNKIFKYLNNILDDYRTIHLDLIKFAYKDKEWWFALDSSNAKNSSDINGAKLDATVISIKDDTVDDVLDVMKMWRKLGVKNIEGNMNIDMDY